ncbi:TonB-dependent receptor [Sphingomonas bacterium]|uniref:TonB-dependent receptor n=1 Tax=Sphingomonas bacterium TaxID=1895847 RepID=UPI001575A3A1|nr:TonB-dependent receptor [Sphingomonas bacterium]
MSSNQPFLALSCVSFLVSSPALAHDDPRADEQPKKDVIVNGERIKQADDVKLVAPLVNLPKSIVVLPSDVIEQTGSNSLQDALRTVPGITFGAAEGGNPIGDRPFIRGFDSQGSIYVDGVRSLGSQTREVFDTDQIEVVRGSDSTLGGRGSAGGTLNIISKLPVADKFGRISASYGEADYKRFTGDVNLALADHIGFRIAGVYHNQDVAGRDAIHQRRWGVAPSLTIGLGTPTRLIASYYHLESHELPDSGIPYLYTIGNAPGTGNILSQPAIGNVALINGRTGYVPRTNFYGLTDRDFRDATDDEAMLRVEHDFGTLTIRNTTRFNHSDQSYIYTQPDDSQGNVYGTAAVNPTTGAAAARGDVLTGGLVWRRGNTRYGYTDGLIDQTDLYGQFKTGSIEHSIAVGTEFAWEQARRGTFVESTGATITPRCDTSTIARYYCTSLFTPNPNDPWVNYTSDTSTTPTPIVKGLPNTETQNDATTQAVYGFDSITIVPRVIVNLGARYDRFSSVLRPAVAAGAEAIRLRRVDGLFNWQAGLVLKPTRETSVYASYATAATPPNSLLGEGREDNALPTTATAANLQLLDDLKPQKTKTYEVGAKASLAHERLQLQAAAFETKIDNARVTSDSGTTTFIGKSRIRGIELTASGTILPGWTVFGGYTYLDPVILDGGQTILTAAAVTQTVGGVTTTLRPAATIAVPSVNTGKQLPQTVRNSFTATTNVTLLKRFQLGGTAIYNDRQYGGYADNRSYTQTATTGPVLNAATRVLYRSVPSYWRFDLRGSVELTPQLELSVNAQNVTDKVYFNQAYASHYASIAPGRTVFGTLSLKL